MVACGKGGILESNRIRTVSRKCYDFHLLFFTCYKEGLSG